MISIITKGHKYHYELEELIKVVFPNRPILFTDEQALSKDGGLFIVSDIAIEDGYVKCKAEIYDQGTRLGDLCLVENIEGDHEDTKRQQKRLIKASILKLMESAYNITIPWGILIGVRPVKLVHQHIDKRYSLAEVRDILSNKYLIREDKIKLMLDIAEVERQYIKDRPKNLISVYLGVPFCPSRCLYCSFTSNPLDKWGYMMGSYIKALTKEIKVVMDFIVAAGKEIETIYIGGGTPTTLSSTDLNKLALQLIGYSKQGGLREFTVEAGRPDTIDRDKLRAMKDGGVNRISINPQTMNENTLKLIGRNHTPQDIISVFKEAHAIGFDIINADIILGLPGETVAMVSNTLSWIRKLSPHNLTVHTMAVKRGSKLKEEYQSHNLPDELEVEKMLQITREFTTQNGMIPYYMYRQKYMVGNLENVGYSLPNKECIYNIQIIEEAQTIIGLGPGAISKVYYPAEDRLERIENVKNLEHYVNRIDEMIERKIKELKNLL